MIIVRFQGGLGNQMFQYAFMRELIYRYPQIDVYADLSDYRLVDYHNGFEISKIFGVDIQEAIDDDVFRLSGRKPWRYGRKAHRAYEIIKRIGRVLGFNNEKNEKDKKAVDQVLVKTNVVHEKDISDVCMIDSIKDDDVYFDGFWPDEKYFFEVKNQIKNELSFGKSLEIEFVELLKAMSSVDSISVHVRRGDYVNTGFDVLTQNYYAKAIDYMNSKLDNPWFYFFSDDPEYVQTEYKAIVNKTIILGNTGNNSYKDMFLMSRCKHNIIANSTFSYWAAELNSNTEKMVIAPKKFSSSRQYPVADSGWILRDN